MRIITTLISLLLLGFGQSILHANFAFNNISPQEMNLEKWLEKYPDQPAVVIGDIGECWFEFCRNGGHPQYLLKRSFRMIILKPEGMDYGNFPIPFYETRRGKEEVSSIKGNVYNLENGKVKRTRIKQRHSFINDLGNNWKEMVIPFPEIKVGSVFEIEYQIRSDYIQELSYWQVQREIPVVFNEFVLRLPAFFSYMLSLRNQDIVRSGASKPFSQTFTITPPRDTNIGYGMRRDELLTFSASGIAYNWVSQEVPPLLPEPYIDNINNYRAGISLELIKIEYPGSLPKLFSQSLESVRDYMLNHDDFGQFLINARRTILSNFNVSNSGNFDDDLLKATREIRQKIKWNQKTGKFATNTPDGILKLGSGNSADVNLLLCVLLRQMGYNAQPLLLSTVDNGNIFSKTPTISKFNYVVVALEKQMDNWILIDATAQGLPPGYIPQRALNSPGMLMLPSSPEWVNILNINNKVTNKVFNFKINQDGTLEGHFTIEYSGYAKHLEKIDIQNKSRGNALDLLASRFEIDKELIKVENLDDTEEPLRLSGNFKIGSSDPVMGNEMFFPFLFFENVSSHPFQLEERVYPVSFASPFSEQIKMEVSIPEGFEVSHYPKQQTIRNRDGLVYSYQVEEDDGKLLITTINLAPKAKVEPQFYGFLKDFNDRVVNLHNNKIIISSNIED